MRFCEWLSYQLDYHEKTMGQVARVLNITKKSAWLHLHGKVFPHLSTFEAYCGYFGISKEEIRSLYYAFREAERR